MYILRLLAGKFGSVCTEFPLTTFLLKFLTRPVNDCSKIKKIYLPSLYLSNKLLSKCEMYISSSETGLYRGKCQRNQFLERARDQALEF